MRGADTHVVGGEGALVEAIRGGDEDAFRTAYRQHAPSMYRLALRMTGGSDADAQDAVQEAWRRAVRGLGGFEGRASLGTWLRAIVARCVLELGRKRSRETGLPPDDVHPGPPVDPVGSVDLERAFECLPPGYRAVLVLHDLEGYRHGDIAALLGVTEGTSKSQLSRARARMRQLLGDDYVR